MAPVVAKIASEKKDTFVVARLNNDKNPNTIRKYLVRGQPVYIVFQDGEIVGRFAREMPKDQLVQKILSALNIKGN